jgi:hypothetical protein
MITLIIGRREVGKTTLALHESRKTPTRLLFDPRRQLNTSPAILRDEIGLYEELDNSTEIIVQPQFNVPQVFEAICNQLMDWIEDNPEEDVSFLVDEARFVQTFNFISQPFDWILRCSKRDKVHTILTVHRPVDVSVDIRAIADFWCIFQTTQEHDLKIIAERCSDQVASEARTLGAGQVIVWNDSRATWKKHTDRAAWYVPLKSPVVQLSQLNPTMEARP